MSFAPPTAQRADEIYRSGPETLFAESPTVAAGPISGYRREVTQKSTGTVQEPDRWIVSAQLVHPQLLKGKHVPDPLAFTRAEWSIFLPPSAPTLYWERTYGDLEEKGQAVVCLDASGKVTKVIPGGQGENNFFQLARTVTDIQRLTDEAARVSRWQIYLRSAVSNEDRKAALRSLARERLPWTQIKPSVETLLQGRAADAEMREYVFGWLTFHLLEETWKADQTSLADFLAQIFAAETEPGLLAAYRTHLNLVIKYCDQGDDATRDKIRRSLEIMSRK